MVTRQADVLIEQAQQAKRKNDLISARSLLRQVIKADPGNEEAWLLFADVAEKNEHAIYSLEQVLKINPANMEALDRLNTLKTPLIPLPVTNSPTTSSSTPILRQPTPNQPLASAPRTLEREVVILEERMHGAVFMIPLLMAVIGIVYTLVTIKLLGQAYALIAVLGGAFFILGAVLALLQTSVRFATSRLTLTTKRIVIKRGLLNRSTFEVLLTKVEGIGVRQPLLGRLFGFGTITVTGTGGAHQVFRGLRDPQGFRERVQQEIAATQAKP